MTHTVDLLLDPELPTGTYVRCNETEQCKLANWLFVASLTIKSLGG